MKKPEISLGRAAGEFTVIVLGVLVALGVDSLNQDRKDSELERDYLQRLQEDVRVDSMTQGWILEVLSEKAEALDLVAGFVDGAGQAPEDSGPLLKALAKDGTAFGWGLPALQSVTLEDLTDTGSMSLLRDPQVRARIIAYYKNANHRLGRISKRQTDYPASIYRILPPDLITAFPQTDPRAPGDLARRESAPVMELSLSGRELIQLMGRLQTEEFRRALNAERNYTGFAREQVLDNLEKASDLLNVLVERQP
jgi:hypothetical protein